MVTSHQERQLRILAWPLLPKSSNSFPVTNKTLKRHMVQVLQGVQSDNPKPQNMHTPQNNVSKDISLPINTQSNEIHIQVEHISKLYTGNTGQFPVLS